MRALFNFDSIQLQSITKYSSQLGCSSTQNTAGRGATVGAERYFGGDYPIAVGAERYFGGTIR
jgi:hypothetical protein